MDSNLTFSIVSAVLQRRKEHVDALVYQQLVGYALSGAPPHTQRVRAASLGLEVAAFRYAEERLVDWGVLLPPKGKYKARTLVLAGTPTPRFIVRVVSGLYPELAILRAATGLPADRLDYRVYGPYHFDTPLPPGYAEAFVAVVRGLFDGEQISQTQVAIELEADSYLPDVILEVRAGSSLKAFTTEAIQQQLLNGASLLKFAQDTAIRGDVAAPEGVAKLPAPAIGPAKRTAPLKPKQHSWQYKHSHTVDNIKLLEPEHWAAAERIVEEWNRVTKQKLKVLPGVFAMIRELLVENSLPEADILEAITLASRDDFWRTRMETKAILDGPRIQALLNKGAKHDRHARGLAGEAPTETREF